MSHLGENCWLGRAARPALGGARQPRGTAARKNLLRNGDYFFGDELLEVGAEGLSGSTCTNVMHWYGSDSSLSPGPFAVTPTRCGPVKNAFFCGAAPGIPVTFPLAFGGTGMENKKIGGVEETS